MPANLPAEAKHKWNEASRARNPKEKLQLLQEFLSLVPKHKGTEKLRAQVKTKMSTLRKEVRARKRRKVGGRGPMFFVEKEDVPQVVVLGQTKVGRSSLLASITNARVEVSNYSYTTRTPIPGMFHFENLRIQLVEVPAIIEGAAEGKAWGQQALGLARNADGLILMVDLINDPIKQFCLLIRELEKARIFVKKPSARVQIERKHMGFGLRIFVVGQLVDGTLKDVEKLLRSYKVVNANVRIYGKATLDDVEESIFESVVFRPAIVVANKFDGKGAAENFKKLEKFVDGRFSLVPISCISGFGLERLGGELFKFLEIIRVYTKEPNIKDPSPTPFVLKRESTIADLAKQIHSDFYRRFSHARVWSKRFAFSPRKVGLSFVLEDEDVVEMHVR